MQKQWKFSYITWLWKHTREKKADEWHEWDVPHTSVQFFLFLPENAKSESTLLESSTSSPMTRF